MNKIFKSANKNLDQNDKHFENLILTNQNNQNQLILNDDLFGNLTFEKFQGVGVKEIGSKTFSKSAERLTEFHCLNCQLANQPPTYNLWSALGQLTQLTEVELGLNVNEMPENAITINQHLFTTVQLTISSRQNLAIQTGAIRSSSSLKAIFQSTTINKYGKDAISLNTFTAESIQLSVVFYNVTIASQAFQSGSFDGIQKPIGIIFNSTNMNYLTESVFKPVLDNKNYLNTIEFVQDSHGTSTLDCSDCKNYWLILDKNIKKDQVKTHCKENPKQTLFDKEIIQKLKGKCK